MQSTQIKDLLHEVNKPLARYKDDVDLDEHLREVDREGDPMLGFLRKKKSTKQGTSSITGYVFRRVVNMRI